MATSSKIKYRSGLEERFHQKSPEFEFEPFKVPYTISRNYIPDFVYKADTGYNVMIECKGFFRVGDTQKYKAIRDCNKFDELIFVFSDPKKKLRKGSKMTLGEWCDKENFKHFTIDTMDELKGYLGIDK
jgi:hypothetical protein